MQWTVCFDYDSIESQYLFVTIQTVRWAVYAFTLCKLKKKTVNNMSFEYTDLLKKKCLTIVVISY